MTSPRPPFPTAIDSTMLSTFKSCHKKFEYSFLRNLHVSEKSIHLVAGGAFAAGLEAARMKCFTPREHQPEWLRAIPPLEENGLFISAFRAFSQEWGTFDLALDHGKSFVNTWYALQTYLTDYHPLTDFIQPTFTPDQIPRIEFSFAIPLPISHPETGDPLLYSGRFDMLAKWDDLLVVLDEKTTSALGDSWRKQWDLRGQFLGYCWACQQLGHPVHAAVARGTAILKTKVNFMTVPVIFPQHLIDRWYYAMLATVETMISAWKHDCFVYDFADGCTAYGGCSYSMLCSAKDPEEWVGNYVTRVWNPISLKGMEA